MAHAQILIVEDVRSVAEQIQILLENLGYTVPAVVSSGEEAIEKAAATHPDLILMDIELSGAIDGIEAAKQIHDRFEIPIVYVTGHEDEETLQRARITEPFGYIVKPFKARDLHTAIEIALYRYEMTRKLGEAENKVRKLRQQLQEAGQHKSNFLASMSHELRTPLNAMIGYTSLTLNALKDSLPREHLQNLTRAEQSARILLQLINDVLDFSKIEAGRMEVFIEEIELSDLLEDVVITAQGLMVEKSIELRSEFPPDLPVIESDYTRVKQILDNLVGNAVKFTSEGYVELRAIPIEDEFIVRVEVKDTGCGIPPETLESIFELFRQVDGSLTKKFGGTGLGLAITKRLSDMLGIKIDVQSEVDKGTIFWLNIPLKIEQDKSQTAITKSKTPQDMDTTQRVEAQAHPSSEKTPSTKVSPFPPPKSSPFKAKRKKAETDAKALVLCFCKQEVCSNLNRHLGGLPLEVQQVTTIAECIEKRKQSLIWTIVLESGENCSEMSTQLKNEPSLQNIPIILMPLEKEGMSAKDPPNKIEPIVQSVMLAETRSILIVDDNEVNLDLMTDVLESAGYMIYRALSAQEGIEIAKKVLPDAIVMDLAMPGMDGFEAIQILKQQPEISDITVIACSALTTREYKDRASQVGCEGYITKPIEPNRLVEQVTRFMLASKIRKRLVQQDTSDKG
jgi:signal transduction histidine kinase